MFSLRYKFGIHDGIFLFNKSSTPIRHSPALLKPTSPGVSYFVIPVLCHFQMSVKDHTTTHPLLTNVHLFILMDNKEDILRRCKPPYALG